MSEQRLTPAQYLKEARRLAEQYDPLQLSLTISMMTATIVMMQLSGQTFDRAEAERDLAELSTLAAIKLGQDSLDVSR